MRMVPVKVTFRRRNLQIINAGINRGRGIIREAIRVERRGDGRSKKILAVLAMQEEYCSVDAYGGLKTPYTNT